MKKVNKNRLFEVMGRLDKTFKPKLNEDMGYDYQAPMLKGPRPLSQIAREIYQDWKPVSPYAKPYLEAMSTLNSIDDNYMMDSGRSIVAYFLSNASQWKGENAKRIKAELKKMLGLKETEEDNPEMIEESGLGTPINKYVYFAYNYPPNFIAQVWADDANLGQHLQGKFSMYYDKYGAEGVMNTFYVNLDSGNQKKLEDWIITNFKG